MQAAKTDLLTIWTARKDLSSGLKNLMIGHAISMSFSLVLFASLYFDWPQQRVDCLVQPPITHIKMKAFVKCFVLGHNKRTYRLVLYAIPSVLSAKQESFEYHLFRSYVLTRPGKGIPDLPTSKRRL